VRLSLSLSMRVAQRPSTRPVGNLHYLNVFRQDGRGFFFSNPPKKLTRFILVARGSWLSLSLMSLAQIMQGCAS
jgi:hypothetical protein